MDCEKLPTQFLAAAWVDISHMSARRPDVQLDHGGWPRPCQIALLFTADPFVAGRAVDRVAADLVTQGINDLVNFSL